MRFRIASERSTQGVHIQQVSVSDLMFAIE